jgi:hypothetical protein
MLQQLVRPMVQTQIRLLANSRAMRPTLISTVAQWLGFLGVRAQVTHLAAKAGRINITLTVDKPEACDGHDWQQILNNLKQAETEEDLLSTDGVNFAPHQHSKIQRLLAYLIQIGNPGQSIDWNHLYPELKALGLDETTLAGIRAALKVPQCLEDLLEGLDSDITAIALPKAVSIAMMDKHVNPSEDHALMALLQAMRRS